MKNIDSTATEKISPHNSDLMKSIFIRNFHSGGALVSSLFLPINEALVSKNRETGVAAEEEEEKSHAKPQSRKGKTKKNE